MTTPLISIIIPVKNRFEWFDETIRSVKQQTFKNYEIIIIDDGSDQLIKDAFPDLQYDKQVKLLRNEKSLGPGGARELGRKLASGKYIHYLDSDDLLHPEYYQKMVNLMASNPNAGMGYCISTTFHQLPITGKEKVYQSSDKVLEHYKFDITARRWCTSSCLWTQKATDRIGPWLEIGQNYGEDIMYDFKAECLGMDVAFLPNILCYYRKNISGGHFTDKNEKMRLNSARSSLTIAKVANENKNKLSAKTIDYLQKSLIHSLAVFSLSNMKAETLDSLKTRQQLGANTITSKLAYSITKAFFQIFPYRLANFIYSKSKFKLRES